MAFSLFKKDLSYLLKVAAVEIKGDLLVKFMPVCNKGFLLQSA